MNSTLPDLGFLKALSQDEIQNVLFDVIVNNTCLKTNGLLRLKLLDTKLLHITKAVKPSFAVKKLNFTCADILFVFYATKT